MLFITIWFWHKILQIILMIKVALKLISITGRAALKILGIIKNTYITPYKNDAYGPDVHSDASGKPFEWETQDGKSSNSKKVKRDGYGLGVGMDEYRQASQTWGLDE